MKMSDIIIYTIYCRHSRTYSLSERCGAFAVVLFLLIVLQHPCRAAAVDTLSTASASGPTASETDSMAAHYLRMVVDMPADEECSLPVVTMPLADTEVNRSVKHPWIAAAEVVGINAFVLAFDRFALDA